MTLGTEISEDGSVIRLFIQEDGSQDRTEIDMDIESARELMKAISESIMEADALLRHTYQKARVRN